MYVNTLQNEYDEERIANYRTPTGVIDHETCTDNFLHRPKLGSIQGEWSYDKMDIVADTGTRLRLGLYLATRTDLSLYRPKSSAICISYMI